MKIATIETLDGKYGQMDSINLKFFLLFICLFKFYLTFICLFMFTFHLSIIVPVII